MWDLLVEVVRGKGLRSLGFTWGEGGGVGLCGIQASPKPIPAGQGGSEDSAPRGDGFSKGSRRNTGSKQVEG